MRVTGHWLVTEELVLHARPLTRVIAARTAVLARLVYALLFFTSSFSWIYRKGQQERVVASTIVHDRDISQIMGILLDVTHARGEREGKEEGKRIVERKKEKVRYTGQARHEFFLRVDFPREQNCGPTTRRRELANVKARSSRNDYEMITVATLCGNYEDKK